LLIFAELAGKLGKDARQLPGFGNACTSAVDGLQCNLGIAAVFRLLQKFGRIGEQDIDPAPQGIDLLRQALRLQQIAAGLCLNHLRGQVFGSVSPHGRFVQTVLRRYSSVRRRFESIRLLSGDEQTLQG
jgi:hypothetical protein